jgi:hypothetical protein
MTNSWKQVILKAAVGPNGEKSEDAWEVVLLIEGTCMTIATFLSIDRARPYAEKIAKEYRCELADKSGL